MLSAVALDEIVALLADTNAMQSPDARASQVRAVFTEAEHPPDINTAGAPREAAQRIAQACQGYGALPSGQPALARLLDLARHEVGDQARIDRLIAAAGGRPGEGAPDPLAAYRLSAIARWSQPRYALDKRFVSLTLLLDQGREAQGQRFIDPQGARRYDDLRDVLRETDAPALVLLGKPGSGKSTLLRRLQMDHAGDGLRDGGGGASFLLSFNEYPRDAEPEPRAWLAQEWRLRYPGLQPFDALLEAGRLLLLLDGLNEMPYRDRAEYERRIAAWRAFLARHCGVGGNRAVFACRSLDYSVSLSGQEAPAQQVTVRPMSEEQIGLFLRVKLPVHQEKVERALRDDLRLLDFYSTPYFAQLLVDQVSRDGRVPDGRAALFTGYVQQALQRELAERHDPLLAPSGPQDGALLDEDDCRQVVQGDFGSHELPEGGCLIPSLSRLAFRMQQSGLRDQSLQVRIPRTEAEALLDHPRAGDILTAGLRLNLLEQDRRDVLFYHQLLQEYFAARELARRDGAARAPDLARGEWRAGRAASALQAELKRLPDYEPLPGLPSSGWEETIITAAALAADADRFVGELAEANLPLAGECAAAAGATVSAEARDRLRRVLIARTEDRRADLRARIAAGLALGRLGDPRFTLRRGPDGDCLLPPLVEIAGGAYVIGDDHSPEKDERPACRVALEAFRIGQFPVTNAEYALFMRAGGYDDERWWDTEQAKTWRRGEGQAEGVRQGLRDHRDWLQGMSDDEFQRLPGWTSVQIRNNLIVKHWDDARFEAWLDEQYPTDKRYAAPAFWDDPNFNNPAQPVVGICWHEARAYCAWLSAQAGVTYRLPTEAEWEAAARGRPVPRLLPFPPRRAAGRRFAYGDRCDAALCNTFDSHIRRTTPVGVFPGGQTPEGAADLCGNVWEWTSSAYLDYPYEPTPEREDPGRTDVRYRLLRGGAWGDAQGNARAAYRLRLSPGLRDLNAGCRVVAAPIR